MEYPSEYLYEALVQSTDDYVYICNMKTGIFQYTPAQVKAFDLPGEVVSSPLIYWKNIVHPDDWDRFYKSNMEIGENKRDAHYVEFRAKQRNGEYVWLRCRGHLIRDEYGNPALFGGIMHRMGGQNKIDPLTQLFNYHVFTRRISQGIENTEMERMAVVILDIDNFRQFNEMYGRKGTGSSAPWRIVYRHCCRRMQVSSEWIMTVWEFLWQMPEWQMFRCFLPTFGKTSGR